MKYSANRGIFTLYTSNNSLLLISLKLIEELKARVKSLTEINESHQKLNGDLRRDNKILADDNAILTDRLREAGM